MDRKKSQTDYLLLGRRGGVLFYSLPQRTPFKLALLSQLKGDEMNYHDVEVIYTTPSEIGLSDPLTHPVDQVSMGVKVDIGGEWFGSWISLAQIVSLLASNLGAEVPYELQGDETEIRLKDD